MIRAAPQCKAGQCAAQQKKAPVPWRRGLNPPCLKGWRRQEVQTGFGLPEGKYIEKHARSLRFCCNATLSAEAKRK